MRLESVHSYYISIKFLFYGVDGLSWGLSLNSSGFRGGKARAGSHFKLSKILLQPNPYIVNSL